MEQEFLSCKCTDPPHPVGRGDKLLRIDYDNKESADVINPKLFLKFESKGFLTLKL